MTVQSAEQAVAASGKRVVVEGTAGREKLGDTITVADLTVHCLDVRFPDAVIGQRVAAEGTLELHEGFAAETNEKGEISQGTGEVDDRRWVLRGCVVK